MARRIRPPDPVVADDVAAGALVFALCRWVRVPTRDPDEGPLFVLPSVEHLEPAAALTVLWAELAEHGLAGAARSHLDHLADARARR